MGALIVIASSLAAVALLVLADRFLLAPRALLTAEDVVTSTGRAITLVATVERDLLAFWDPPIADAEVTFHAVEEAGRRVLGTARTGATGTATLALPAFDAPARLRGVATIAGPLPAFEAPFIVDVLAPDREVFVIDIDRTIASVGPLQQAMRDNAKIRPLDGAADAVRSLGPRYATVLLTARDHIFRAKTLEWLRDNGFPEMPLLMRRGKRFWQQKAEPHKRERLEELSRAVRLAAGAGDLPADALVYRERGMRAYLIGGAAADGAIAVRTWKAILDDLNAVPPATASSASTPHPPAAAPSQSGTPGTGSPPPQ